MAHFFRGKQLGIQDDFSAGLLPELFKLDDFARYGVNSQISALAYDPVQSLLAVGTKDTQFGAGKIYVFGQKRVCVTFELQRRATVKIIKFCADKLLSVDSKNDLCVYSLVTKELVTAYAPPGLISALEIDPTIDYAFIGMQTGEIIAYDLDRLCLTAFKVPNSVWRELSPKSRLLPVVSLALHPRDLGTLLIGYSEGAVIYSFKQDKALKYFRYEVPIGAPGGFADSVAVKTVRRPRLTQALWHPTGTFILTCHEDSSMVFWDPKDVRVVMARTMEDTDINKPRASSEGSPRAVTVKHPIYKIAWCSKENPDDTGVLVAGGLLTTSPSQDLTFMDLGPTPIYAASSWKVLSEHFENPKRQTRLPLPPNAEVIDFCLIPRSSPHYGRAHDPIAVLCLLSSGELVTMSFPSGYPITPTNQLHIDLSFVHPFATRLAFAGVDRTRWLGLTERRSHGPSIAVGGAEAKRPLKRFEKRNIVLVSHADGTIRLWDAGHADEIENENALQVDVARAVASTEGVDITHMSFASATGELAVGLKSGQLVVFRWGINKHQENKSFTVIDNLPGIMTDIADRADPELREGLLPLKLLDQQQGPVTALKLSEIGFLAVGFETGNLTIIDLRDSSIIFDAKFEDFAKQEQKRSSFRRSSRVSMSPKSEWPVTIEFGVMTLEGEEYSSILCFVGTNLGRVASFKILPAPGGGYSVAFAGYSSMDDRIVKIIPINSQSGAIAAADPDTVAGLRTGLQVHGVVLVVTQNSATIYKPASAKGVHKSWDDYLCDAAAVTRYEERGYALIGLFGDGCARAFSIPGLKEIGAAKVDHILDVKRFHEAVITMTGDIFGWLGPSELAVLNVWGTGRTLSRSQDVLFNAEALIPPRPTISNLQWVSGTQYVSPADMDMLIAGPDRPPSQRMIAQMRAEEQQRRLAARNPQSAASAAVQDQDEGYWTYMQRQIQERTEKLGLASDNMDRLEENSSSWANDVNKFVNKQKTGLMMGAFKSKFGF